MENAAVQSPPDAAGNTSTVDRQPIDKTTSIVSTRHQHQNGHVISAIMNSNIIRPLDINNTRSLQPQTIVTVSGLTEQIGFSNQYLDCNQHVNIEFEKLTVCVPNRSCAPSAKNCGPDGKREKTKVILNGISGSFRAGQLTGIMGPSGAGKTTLMNILAGYSSNYYAGGGVDGIVRVNGQPRDLSKFRKSACYIMQQDHLTPNLTVREIMQIVAALKLPLHSKRTSKQRQARIDDVVETLGLGDCLDTYTQNLSGGQRKRVVIAQELINNPPVMLFDEPTSGLDSAACLQCIVVLKKLASGGRTIICSIHQPSTRIFEMFDQIYMLSAVGGGGQCIYRGGGATDLVSYFDRHDFPCPPYYNPADFVTEIASGQHSAEVLQKYVDLIREEDGDCRRQPHVVVRNEHRKITGNDKTTYWRAPGVSFTSDDGATNTAVTDSPACSKSTSSRSDDDDIFVNRRSKQKIFVPSSPLSYHVQRTQYPASYWQQFRILSRRLFLSVLRDATLTRLRLASHILVGVILGLLYYNVGNESSKILNNASLLFFSLLFVMFGGMMPTITMIPLEINCVLREHLNYWYSLKMYCLAKLVTDVPFQCIFPLFYGCIAYWLSGQPHDLHRLALFLLCLIATSLIAQSIGLLTGALITNIQDAVFFGPVTAIPMLLFSGFFINLNAIPSYFHWLSYVSYIRFSFEASIHAIYGYDRVDLDCNADATDKYSFCIWHTGKDFLTYMNMEDARFWNDMVVLLGFFILIRLATYFALRARLSKSRMAGGKCN